MGFVVYLWKDYRKVGIHKTLLKVGDNSECGLLDGLCLCNLGRTTERLVYTSLLNKLVTRKNVPSWVGFVLQLGKYYIKFGIHEPLLYKMSCKFAKKISKSICHFQVLFKV